MNSSRKGTCKTFRPPYISEKPLGPILHFSADHQTDWIFLNSKAIHDRRLHDSMQWYLDTSRVNWHSLEYAIRIGRGSAGMIGPALAPDSAEPSTNEDTWIQKAIRLISFPSFETNPFNCYDINNFQKPERPRENDQGFQMNRFLQLPIR
jgi:hypothetical protein